MTYSGLKTYIYWAKEVTWRNNSSVYPPFNPLTINLEIKEEKELNKIKTRNE